MIDPAEMDRDEASATKRSVERLFDRTEAPDAVYVPLEVVGVEVLRAMLGMRLAIPDDVLLATTHDRGQARTANPPITTKAAASTTSSPWGGPLAGPVMIRAGQRPTSRLSSSPSPTALSNSAVKWLCVFVRIRN